MSNKMIPFEQALSLFVNSNTQPLRLLKEPGCLSFLKLEKDAKNEQPLSGDDSDHLLWCPRCKSILEMMRKHCSVPVRSVTPKAIERLYEWANSINFMFPAEAFNAVEGDETPPRSYRIVIEDHDGSLGEARAMVVDGPFVSDDGCLVMRGYFEVPASLRNRFPIQLLLVALPDEQPLRVLDLPDFDEQSFSIKLDQHLLDQSRQQINEEASLPFGLVLRLGNAPLLAEASPVTVMIEKRYDSHILDRMLQRVFQVDGGQPCPSQRGLALASRTAI